MPPTIGAGQTPSRVGGRERLTVISSSPSTAARAPTARQPPGSVDLDVKHGHWNAAHRNTVMLETAKADAKGNPKPMIFVEQEPGPGGNESAQATIRDLAGFPIRAIPATTNILERADPLAAQAQAGNLWMVLADWNELVLNEFHSFDGSDKGHNVTVSAAALAFNSIARFRPPEIKSVGSFSVWTG